MQVTVDQLFREVEATEGYRLAVDLAESVGDDTGWGVVLLSISILFANSSLLNGLDEIGLTLQHADKIKAFEDKHRATQPWLFA